jgi:hypothetical protein
MDQEQENSAPKRPRPILFSNNEENVNEIVARGIDLFAVIKKYLEKPDPHDDEHSIIHLEFEYEVGTQLFKQELEFSINIVHIMYGFSGGLINTPKFKYSLDDFRKSMQPGQKLKVKILVDNPDMFVLEANDVMTEIMRHEAVWR